MKRETHKNWQSVRKEVLNRIHSRQWKPGELIPNEADLAQEFGCARSTVNRALQNLADDGLLDRRRKAGTRVAMHPVRKATMSIPVIRNEIIARGSAYGYDLISSERSTPPPHVAALMGLAPRAGVIHIVCVHSADDTPYVIEDRWISSDWVSPDDMVNFANLSPNEWLVTHVPFTAGDIAFSAISAGAFEAALLGCELGAASFVIDRTTRNNERTITTVRLIFAPGYRIDTEI